jgi:hypothetical protein
MRGLILGSKIKNAIQVNELAYELEKTYPHLGFYEISKLVKERIQLNPAVKSHLTLVSSCTYFKKRG